jgi:hypothetical protein
MKSIPNAKHHKTPDHRFDGKTFSETVKLRGNSVNGGFPNRVKGGRNPGGPPPKPAPKQFNLWRIRVSIPLADAQLSTLRKAGR